VTPRQRKILEGITRTKLAAQQLVERCRVILLSAEGQTNIDQAVELGVDRQRVRRWRHRWPGAMASLVAAEEGLATDKGFWGPLHLHPEPASRRKLRPMRD
jgi:hypothetical protein